MIDLSLIGKRCGPIPFNYTWKDVVLYALSIGAQADELPFVYEGAKGGLKVFPSFCTIMGYRLFGELFQGVDIDYSRFIHGEEWIRLFAPLPPEGSFLLEGGIKDIYDKGKGALIVRWTRVSQEDGTPLAEIENGIFYVGEGGFGGNPGPKAHPFDPPQGAEPDFTVSYDIPPNQAALYRLNGDLNPLHLDPEFAKRGGFPRPILHGLCTFGYTVRGIVHAACSGDVGRLQEFKARFSGVVYPGDTLTIRGWKDEGERYIIQSSAGGRVVLSQSFAIVGK